MSRIKIVFFDLGGVLVDVHMDRFIDGLSLRSDLNKQQIIHSLTDSELDFLRFQRGHCSPQDIFSLARSQCHYSGPFEEFVHIYTNIFTLKDEVAALVEEIADRFTVSIISNTDVLHFDYLLQTYPVMAIFTQPTTSFRVGALKPDAKIYWTALNALGAAPTETFFIDDKEENVTAAKKLAMNAMLYSDAASILKILRDDRILN